MAGLVYLPPGSRSCGGGHHRPLRPCLLQNQPSHVSHTLLFVCVCVHVHVCVLVLLCASMCLFFQCMSLSDCVIKCDCIVDACVYICVCMCVHLCVYVCDHISVRVCV